MSAPSDTGLWTKAKEAALPISLNYALMFLGLWFILIPAGVAIGIWGYYGFGLLAALVIGFLTRRYYRQIVVERGDGYCVLRFEYLPWRNRTRGNLR